MDFRMNFEGCEPAFPKAGPLPGGSAWAQGLAGLAAGMVAGTEVATAEGWRTVETLQEDDRVMTVDHGLQPLCAVQRGLLWRGDVPCPLALWPLHVPPGALGNDVPLALLPEQSVLLESEVAEMLYGSPFVLMPARLLAGFMGIARKAPVGPVEVVVPIFDTPQIAYANGAARLFCRAEHDVGAGTRLEDSDVPVIAGYAAPETRIARVVAQALRIAQTEDAPHAA